MKFSEDQPHYLRNAENGIENQFMFHNFKVLVTNKVCRGNLDLQAIHTKD